MDFPEGVGGKVSWKLMDGFGSRGSWDKKATVGFVSMWLTTGF